MTLEDCAVVEGAIALTLACRLFGAIHALSVIVNRLVPRPSHLSGPRDGGCLMPICNLFHFGRLR